MEKLSCHSLRLLSLLLDQDFDNVTAKGYVLVTKSGCGAEAFTPFPFTTVSNIGMFDIFLKKLIILI